MNIVLSQLINADSIIKLLKHQGKVRTVDFSPDGKKLVSGSFDQTLVIWDLEAIMQKGAVACRVFDHIGVEPNGSFWEE